MGRAAATKSEKIDFMILLILLETGKKIHFIFCDGGAFCPQFIPFTAFVQKTSSKK
jgi:hypothetical protein